MQFFGMFSVDNNYDQPPNNLVVLWVGKPTLPQVAEALGLSWPGDRDEDILNVVKIWQGKDVVRIGNTDYRIDELYHGKVLK